MTNNIVYLRSSNQTAILNSHYQCFIEEANSENKTMKNTFCI